MKNFKPSGFLSEMSAEPIHGGGVTLHRVLGDDLTQFNWFAQTLRFPQQAAASYETAPNHDFPWWQHEKRLRPFLGCTRAHKLSVHPTLRRAFAKQTAKTLLKQQPELLNSRLLVCPQADISLLVLEELQKKAPIEYITWVMDDHMIKWQHDQWQYPRPFENSMRKHLQGAHKIYVISPAMQDFYKEK